MSCLCGSTPLLAVSKNADAMSEASDSELRDASRRTRSLLSSAFCPAAKRVPTLAVLLVGEVRTLTLPHVYWSIAQHAIDAPGADAKLFMDLKRGLYEGHEPTMQKVHRQSTATVALERALKVLQPAGIRIDHADSSLGPHLMRPDCTVDHGHHYTSLTRTIGRWLSVRSAYEMMRQHEAAAGAEFDAVMQIRSDDVWLAPLPPWCTFTRLFRPSGAALGQQVAYLELVGSRSSHYVGGADWWYLLSRRAASSVLNLADMYLSCTGNLSIVSSEYVTRPLEAGICAYPPAQSWPVTLLRVRWWQALGLTHPAGAGRGNQQSARPAACHRAP